MEIWWRKWGISLPCEATAQSQVNVYLYRFQNLPRTPHLLSLVVVHVFSSIFQPEPNRLRHTESISRDKLAANGCLTR